MAVHAASRRIMEKCGMGLLREFHADWPHWIPEDEHGDVAYVLDRADWERKGNEPTSRAPPGHRREVSIRVSRLAPPEIWTIRTGPIPGA
jgi:hypothetical protein